MILNVKIDEKSINNKVLYENMSFFVNLNEKVGFIGRNGTGKTTLFKIISGEDKDYKCVIDIKKDTKIILTKQEYSIEDSISSLDYVMQSLPEYIDLKNIIDKYPDIMGSDMDLIDIYTKAINLFSEYGYYNIEDQVLNSLLKYKIDKARALMPLIKLSGGEKRFVELVKIMYSDCDIALIDEPTNHMDDIGKNDFISWFKNTTHGICVITHDRDVLNYVDKIIEIKDKKAFTFPGNYDSYLSQNSITNVTKIQAYEGSLKSLDRLKKQVESIKKRGAHASTRVMYERVGREYDKVKKNLEKPSIWIDEESIKDVNKKIADKYEKYKDKNISIKITDHDIQSNVLLKVKKISIGYKYPLFSNISFILSPGDKVHLKGRNGAGKTSLIKTIISAIENSHCEAKIYEGEIIPDNKIKLGIYEQEIDNYYFNMTLEKAVEEVYQLGDIPMPNVNKILNDYLFNPSLDRDLLVKNLSGGQKSRFQIIKMLSNNPNLLILDEPTNHLDLPSIEELENILKDFHGGILYVSHDSYFVKKLKGEIIRISE